MTNDVRCAGGLNLREGNEQLIARVQQHGQKAHDLDLVECRMRSAANAGREA